MIHQDLTEEILGAAIEVHRALGPGLLESAYEDCLCHELGLRGFRFQGQVAVPLTYKGTSIECGYRVDLLVEDVVIVEIKCVERILPVHEAQLLTYLRLSAKKVGLLISFHVPALKDGVVRRVI